MPLATALGFNVEAAILAEAILPHLKVTLLITSGQVSGDGLLNSSKGLKKHIDRMNKTDAERSLHSRSLCMVLSAAGSTVVTSLHFNLNLVMLTMRVGSYLSARSH